MTLLLSYARERIATVRVGAAVLLAVAGAQSVHSLGAALLARNLALAALLVVSFRIWDDVMDRSRDRERHPERVAVRAGSITPLAAAAFLMWDAAALLTWLVTGLTSVALLLAFTALLAIWYAARGPRSSRGDRLLLAKYAVFTIVLIGVDRAFTVRGASAAATVYLASCVYEWVHDADAPASPRAHSIEAALLAAACVALGLSVGGVR
jgi:hypothetical protein